MRTPNSQEEDLPHIRKLAQQIVAAPFTREELLQLLEGSNVREEVALPLAAKYPDKWREFLISVFEESAGSRTQLSLPELITGFRKTPKAITGSINLFETIAAKFLIYTIHLSEKRGLFSSASLSVDEQFLLGAYTMEEIQKLLDVEKQ